MIYLGEIPKNIIDKHWDYFINSEGYSKIKDYAQDPSISQRNNELFRKLEVDNSLLKLLIIGRPHELRKIVRYFRRFYVQNSMGLKAYFKFSTYLEWSVIEKEIQKFDSPVKKKDKKFNLDLAFNDIERLLSISPVDRKLTQQSLKCRWQMIRNTLYSTGVISEIQDTESLLSKVFDYDKFIVKTTKWNGYRLTEELSINVCPYCNRNYIHTLRTGNGSTRPELDHFYPKSIYPFLSISIYNLIPSCHICNSNLKGSIDFFIREHLHPFEYTNHNQLKFKIEYKPAVSMTPLLQIEDFDIVCDFIKESENDENKMIKNSVETFKTEKLYNFHKDVAQEIVFNAVYYNETKRDELKKLFGDQNEIDDNFIDRVIYGNYIGENDFGKRPLSKFTSDLVAKLKDISSPN